MSTTTPIVVVVPPALGGERPGRLVATVPGLATRSPAKHLVSGGHARW